MSTRRVICPLLSQNVTLLARYGSSGAGWTLPSTSYARDLIACSPAAGFPQCSVQNLQANLRARLLGDGWRKSRASLQGPSSTWTSTALIGAPQAAPMIR